MEGNSKASLEGTSEGRAREDRRQHSSVELSSSNSDGDGICRVRVRSVTSKDAQLEATKSEMGEVRKENERLRMQLDRMIKDYHALQEQFQGAARKQNDTIIPAASATNQATTPATDATSESHPHRGLEEEETELVSLSLGRKTSIDLQRSKVSQGSEKDGLALGLRDYKLFQGSESDARADGFHVPGHENVTSSTEEVAPSGWPPQKILKRREGNEPPHPSNGKRARVCLRIRCETPTMNDGCQWRKYGQKIAKGNPCPRAYYRCTVAPACPVRKQVQRCAEDMSILIITYEGTHNHPLPISATGMASTTAAAASMLLSGPSSTLTNPSTSRPSPPLNGLSFHAPHSISNIQLPITSSSSNPNPNTNPNHQTITLDLTTSNNTFTPSQSPHFNLFPKSSISFPTQYSSRPTSLDFSSSSPNSLRGNSGNTMFNYSSLRANTSSNHINQFATSSTTDHHSSFHQSTMQRNNTTDTINSAIMSDPSFQSALAAALTTIIGGGDGQLQGMISGLQSGSSTRGLNNSIGLLHASSSGSRPTMTSPGAALANSASTSPSDNIKEHSI